MSANTRRLRIGILFGGRSAEHEISILSARNVVASLDRTRFEPVLVGIGRDGTFRLLEERVFDGMPVDPREVVMPSDGPGVSIEAWPGGSLRTGEGRAVEVDAYFPVLHGPMGEDGTVQGLLELADVPYVGAGVLGAAAGMDKDVMKRLLREADVPIGRFIALRKRDFEHDPAAVCARVAGLGFPLFTKPANLGSSVGVSRVASAADLRRALEHAFEFDIKAIAEEAIVGREIECSVLGGESPTASIPGEIVVQHREGFYSYDAKYVDEHGATLAIPAPLSSEDVARVQAMAIRTFEVIECHGLGRVDFFLEANGRLLVNEINTHPGFTRISMYTKLWEATGLPSSELVSRLIDDALARHAEKRRLRTRPSAGSASS